MKRILAFVLLLTLLATACASSEPDQESSGEERDERSVVVYREPT